MSHESSSIARSIDQSERQLLLNAKAGDREAWEELIQRSRIQCTRVARNFLRSSADTADTLQTAFYLAFTRLNSFRGEARFSNWVARIVATQCLMNLRSPHRKRIVSYDCDPRFESRWQTRAWQNDPESTFAQRQLATILRSELSCLPVILDSAPSLAADFSFRRTPPAGIPEGQRFEQDGVDCGEDCAIRADAKGESDNGDGCKGGAAAKLAQSVIDILREIIEVVHSAHIPTLLFDLLRATQFLQSRVAGFLLAYPTCDLFLDQLFQVVAKFVAQFLFDSTLAE
jgi:RNA polymerase sigma factor (sigma-70 family)